MNPRKPYRRKTCLAIATQRARQARDHQNRRSFAIAFAWSLLLLLIQALTRVFSPSAILGRSSRQEIADNHSVAQLLKSAESCSRSPSPIGGQCKLNPSLRYRLPPTLSRLMKDLRRAAVSKEAAAELEGLVVDPITREWVRDCISAGEIDQLSVWVRPNQPEFATLQAWKREAEVARSQRTLPCHDEDREYLLGMKRR